MPGMDAPLLVLQLTQQLTDCLLPAAHCLGGRRQFICH